MNALSGLNNWRKQDSAPREPEFKSMRNFDEQKPQIQRVSSYKSEKVLPIRSTRNFASTSPTYLEEKLYHPSVTFECNDVQICVKMYDVYKSNATAVVVPCLLNEPNNKLTQRMCKFLSMNIHEVLPNRLSLPRRPSLGPCVSSSLAR